MSRLAHSRILRFLLLPLLALSALAMAVPPVPGTVNAAAAIHLSPATAAPGDRVVVTGLGYIPRDVIVVTSGFRTPGSPKSVQVNTHARDDGSFITAFTVPTDAYGGAYTVRARDSQNHAATTALTVLPLAMLVAGAPSPPAINVASGHLFFASGSGFSPGETVNIAASFPMYNGNTVTIGKAVKADTGGRFHDILLRIPLGAKTGKTPVTATGATSKKTATADIGVVYYPWVRLLSAAVRPGQTATFEGAGFVPNSTVHLSLPITNGSTAATLSKDVTTDDHGTFTTGLDLPPGAQTGTYTLTTTDTTGKFSTTTPVAVTLKPVVSLSSDTVSPGAVLTITGGGYTARAPIHIGAIFPLYEGGTRTVTTTVRTDAKGNFTASLRVPGHAAAGKVTVTAEGPRTRSQATLLIRHVGASIVLQPSALVPGSRVVIYGTGYPAGDKVDISVPVRLTDGSHTTLAATVHANNNGRFSLPLKIPGNVITGTYAVIARSEFTGRMPRALLHLSVSARISVRPNAARPGSPVVVTGGGFSANVPVTITASFPLFNGGTKDVSTTVHTDAYGALTGTITIPGNAAAGPVTVSAKGPNARVTTGLNVGHLTATVLVSPSPATPGATVHISGNGYLSGSQVDITVTLKTLDGANKTLTATVTTDASGRFNAQLQIPGNIVGGAYTVIAHGHASGRAPQATLTIAKLAPSIVAMPATAVPGTVVTVRGFGFAPGASVKISLQNQQLTTVTANAAGQFSSAITIPASTAGGSYALSAVSNNGRKSTISLAVNRQVSTHFYFASLYTGTNYHEYLTVLNPTEIRANVTVTYQLTNGATRVKRATINAHSRFTEDVNADLGPRVSSAAVVAADVPIAAERLVYHGTDGSVVPGVTAPATIWYFANGNTTGKYREYIAIQNPNSTSNQVSIRFLPTHRRAFTVTRTMAPTSRLTIKVNSFVHDAVGIVVTSSAPSVANRTIFIHHGMASKMGVTSPQRTWYFAGGPSDPAARYYIGAINGGTGWTRMTLRMYDAFGQQVGTLQTWLKPHGRGGYAIHRLAHHTDVAVVLTSSRPVVAEQTTYAHRMHDASTDAFGVSSPLKTWEFAAASTQNGSDILSVFNPNLLPVPVVVQFLSASGTTIARTYVVPPLAHERIDVGSVEPNAQLGLTVASNYPIVCLNRLYFNNHRGSGTSTGIHS